MKSEGKGRQGTQINVTTQRNAASVTNNFELTSIKALSQKQPRIIVTEEELKAITKDGRDVFYTALCDVAIRRGNLIIREAST